MGQSGAFRQRRCRGQVEVLHVGQLVRCLLALAAPDFFSQARAKAAVDQLSTASHILQACVQAGEKLASIVHFPCIAD